MNAEIIMAKYQNIADPSPRQLADAWRQVSSIVTGEMPELGGKQNGQLKNLIQRVGAAMAMRIILEAVPNWQQARKFVSLEMALSFDYTPDDPHVGWLLKYCQVLADWVVSREKSKPKSSPPKPTSKPKPKEPTLSLKEIVKLMDE